MGRTRRKCLSNAEENMCLRLCSPHTRLDKIIYYGNKCLRLCNECRHYAKPWRWTIPSRLSFSQLSTSGTTLWHIWQRTRWYSLRLQKCTTSLPQSFTPNSSSHRSQQPPILPTFLKSHRSTSTMARIPSRLQLHSRTHLRNL